MWTTMTRCRLPALLQASATMLPLAPAMASNGTAGAGQASEHSFTDEKGWGTQTGLGLALAQLFSMKGKAFASVAGPGIQ